MSFFFFFWGGGVVKKSKLIHGTTVSDSTSCRLMRCAINFDIIIIIIIIIIMLSEKGDR